jgi:biopolymer transport protein ExbB/TolQ
MFQYFYQGGPLFMSLLTIVFLAAIVVAVLPLVKPSTEESLSKKEKNLKTVKSLGLFALVLGMLGQFIGLFEAFRVIESGVTISPAMLAGGVKVSMITSIYGMLIFVILYLLSFLMKLFTK